MGMVSSLIPGAAQYAERLKVFLQKVGGEIPPPWSNFYGYEAEWLRPSLIWSTSLVRFQPYLPTVVGSTRYFTLEHLA